jgi:hypothetical protein
MIVASGSADSGGVRLVLESEEAMLLAELADQVETVLLLDHGDDPALDRLFPTAYRDDADAADEFARYTRDGLAETKRAAARGVRETTGAETGSGPVEVELAQAEAWEWLTFLTDLRLILAERVGIVDDGGSPEPQDEREGYLRSAYEWVGFVQGSMLEVLDPTG